MVRWRRESRVVVRLMGFMGMGMKMVTVEVEGMMGLGA
jgi:hypothetical protein